MIKPFKFFKGYVYSDEYTFQDTAEGYVYRRHLYHTDREAYDRLRHPNNEMERYFYDRNLRHDRLTEERRADATRWINEGRIKLFQTTTVTKVNPKWWMKIKMFFQEVNFDNILGIILIAGSLTFGVILVISKLLNVW
jgi:hypothetical protein